MNNSIIKFKALQLWLRLVSFGFGALILGINLYAMKDGLHSVVAIILGILFVCASIYENSWSFDKDKQIAIQKYGTLLLSKKRIIKFSEIFGLTTETFKQPARISSLTQINMRLVDGTVIVIDRDKTKNLEDQIFQIEELQMIIKRNNEKAAQDFIDAVTADILK